MCSTPASICTLRLDHIDELWAGPQTEPRRACHLAGRYDHNKKLIIQFFGKRHEGEDEREDWRFLKENLPRLPRHVAA